MHISLAAEVLGTLWGFPITNSFVHAILVTLALLALGFAVRRRMGNLNSLLYVAADAVTEAVEGLVKGMVGHAQTARKVVPFAATIFLFVIVANWSGLLPGVGSIGFTEHEEAVATHEDVAPAHEETAPAHEEEAAAVQETGAAEHGEAAPSHEKGPVFIPLFRSAYSDLNMTLALALLGVGFVQVLGLQALGVGYLSKFFTLKNPIYTFVGLLELLSEIVKIFSFSFRLFGNIFAGEVLLTVISTLLPYVGPIPFLGIELFAGAVQALIFTMLTLVFIGGATTAHDDHEEHGSGHDSHGTPVAAPAH